MSDKYIDIDDLAGWSNEERWPSKDGRPLPKAKQLKEVKEDANKRLRLCSPEALEPRARRNVHDGTRSKSDEKNERTD